MNHRRGPGDTFKGKLDGKVAFITGAARGQGRSHAVEMAREGADIIAIDICRQISTVEYAMATPEDLEHTAALVKAEGQRVFTAHVDVCDLEALTSAVKAGEDSLGPVDIIIANAGIAPVGLPGQDRMAQFRDVIDVNLNGAYHTVLAAVGSLIEKGEGSIILVSSTQGLKGTGGHGTGASVGYTSAKHALVGMMRNLANWLGPKGVRVNTIHPTGVATPMIQNPVMEKIFADPNSKLNDSARNLLPIPWLEPADVSKAVIYLVSDDGRYITGVPFPVDAGFAAR